MPRFEELRDARGRADPVLARVDRRRADLLGDRDPLRPRRGLRTTRCARQRDAPPAPVRRSPPRHGVALGATGTHPWADYREQHIIDTEHYRRVVDGLQYVARRNNTFSLHVHVGVRGADRAVRVCDRLRPVLPMLLAISANSPYVDGRDSGLHSARTQTFTKTLPALRHPRRLRRPGRRTRDYVEFLVAHRLDRRVHAGVVVGAPALHASAPSRCASATRRRTAPESEALAALIVACVAQAARDEDEGAPARRPAAAPDRGEPVARDPLRAWTAG